MATLTTPSNKKSEHNAETKLPLVKLVDLIPWYANNPRHDWPIDQPSIDKIYTDDALQASMQVEGVKVNLVGMRGDKDRKIVHAPGETARPMDPRKVYVIQGNRRTFNLHKLAEKGIETAQNGDDLTQVEVRIFERLTDEELTRLTHDHGHKGLDKSQVFLALERRIRASQGGRMTDKDIVNAERTLIDAAYPVKPDKKDDCNTPEKYFKYRKGVYQTAKAVALGPKIMRDQYYAQLSGIGESLGNLGQDDIRELSDIYTKEVEEDRSGKISPINPGPKFLEKWEQWKKAEAEAKNTGNAPKPTSMMSRDGVEQTEKQLKTRLLKFFAWSILRVKGWGDDDIARLDEVGVMYAEGKSKEAEAVLDELTASKA